MMKERMFQRYPELKCRSYTKDLNVTMLLDDTENVDFKKLQNRLEFKREFSHVSTNQHQVILTGKYIIDHNDIPALAIEFKQVAFFTTTNSNPDDIDYLCNVHIPQAIWGRFISNVLATATSLAGFPVTAVPTIDFERLPKFKPCDTINTMATQTNEIESLSNLKH
jgi:preprotein translocase subunit SecB